MTVLSVPTTHNPPYVLLALGLLQGAELHWDHAGGETGEVKYGDIIGNDNVRAALEANVPGKEVSEDAQLLDPQRSA